MTEHAQSIYLVSTVGSVILVEQFPELKPLSQNWETIRDEAVGLFGGGFIRGRQEQRLGLLLVLQKWLEGPDKPRHDIRDVRLVLDAVCAADRILLHASVHGNKVAAI